MTPLDNHRRRFTLAENGDDVPLSAAGPTANGEDQMKEGSVWLEDEERPTTVIVALDDDLDEDDWDDEDWEDDGEEDDDIDDDDDDDDWEEWEEEDDVEAFERKKPPSWD
jgi:hypothetical protein